MRKNRLRAGEVAAIAGASTLSATTRRSTSSNARKTIPNPPLPRTWSTSVMADPAGWRNRDGWTIARKAAGSSGSSSGFFSSATALRAQGLPCTVTVLSGFGGRPADFERPANRHIQELTRLEVGGQQFFHLVAELGIPAASLVQISSTASRVGQVENGQKDYRFFLGHGENPRADAGLTLLHSQCEIPSESWPKLPLHVR